MKKAHIFWQAAVIASIIFWIGIFIGISVEKSRIEKMENFYLNSQIDFFDFELASEIAYFYNLNCNTVNEKSIEFADRIYEEALKLEKYEELNKVNKESLYLHRKYDLLRTMLWKKIIESKKYCQNFSNTIIYFYGYVDPPLNIKALQSTMSNSLLDLKTEYGKKIILIPIAIDTNIKSLDSLKKVYGLEDTYPMIFVNEKIQITNLENIKDIEKYLN